MCIKNLPTKQSCSLSWIKINLMGLLEMKMAHVHTSLHAVYKNRFPASALWNVAVIVNGSSCSSLSTLQHRAFFLFPYFFIPSYQSPGGVCGQLVLPQWCGDFLGLPGWGQAPLWAPHTWLRGLTDLDLAPWRLAFFLPRGKLVCLYQSINGKGCEVIFFRGAYAIWYSCKPYSLPR